MQFKRREILKLSPWLASALSQTRFIPPSHPAAVKSQNVIVLLFDTWTAMNISLHGYSRETTPNLSRIVDKAILYHNHFAGGHETYSGTTALLTGAFNWTTWGFGADKAIRPPFDQANMFSAFNDYHRLLYTHNPVAEQVLKYFTRHIDHYQPRQSLYINSDYWLNDVFGKDFDIAGLSWVRLVSYQDEGYANSLFVGHLYEKYQEQLVDSYRQQFPLGPPVIQQDNYFILEDAINWIQQQAINAPRPYLGYYHLLPPHAKYTPRREFFDRFKSDGFEPLFKPTHPLANRPNDTNLSKSRKMYDEYILYVDAELGRLYDFLQANSLLEDTWLVITSDHGEMFERGIYGHRQPTFHNPVIRVPLLIFPPGYNSHQDIFEPTSAVDVTPTLLHLTGHKIPAAMDGLVLPPFTPYEYPLEREIFASAWDTNLARNIRTNATAMLVKGQYKLISYEGYSELPGKQPYFELYDYQNDPQELVNLFQPNSDLSVQMLQILQDRMRQAESKSS